MSIGDHRTIPLSGVAQEALRQLQDWAPARWGRNDDRNWQPARYSTEPPSISKKVMERLIERGLVRVTAYTSKGAADIIELAQ